METTKLPDPTLLERAIEYVSPRWAAQRLKQRAMMAIVGGYIGGRYDKTSTRSWFTTAQSADVDTVYDLFTLRARSRDLIRNSPMATGSVGTIATNVIGSGLSLMAQPDAAFLKIKPDDAAEWVQTVEREFRCWCESPECDVTRTQNFYGLQALAFRSTLESGDCFALLPMAGGAKTSPYSLQIQLIEADRIGTPGAFGIVAVPGGVPNVYGQQLAPGLNGAGAGNRIVAGVEVNPTGAPVAYHISTQHPGDVAVGAIKWNRVPAFGSKTGMRNVLHMFERSRPGQNRGVPILAPVVEQLKQLDRYSEAELMASVVSAMFTVFVETESGTGLDGEGLPLPTGSNTGVAGTRLLDNSKNQIGMGNGSIIDLVPGEKVSFANPGRPNTAFDPFVTSILRGVGVAIGLPYEVLVKHFTASYSAARAALLQAWQMFKLRRDFMSTQFCNPVYEAWMCEAVASGRISAPGFFDDPMIRRAYLACSWVGDAPLQIDPLKEIQACELRLQVGVSDLKSETMELRGVDWEVVHEQQVREKEARVKGGLEAEAIQPIKPLGPKGSENPAPVGPTTAKPTEPGQTAKPGTVPAPPNQESGDGDNETN
jgi:lambda family phage portal protein